MYKIHLILLSINQNNLIEIKSYPLQWDCLRQPCSILQVLLSNKINHYVSHHSNTGRSCLQSFVRLGTATGWLPGPKDTATRYNIGLSIANPLPPVQTIKGRGIRLSALPKDTTSELAAYLLYGDRQAEKL